MHDDTARVRGFILGDLSEEEQVQLEESFAAPRLFLEALDRAADSLCDDYVRGGVSQHERERVRELARADAWRQRIRLAAAFLHEVDEESAQAPGALSASPSRARRPWWLAAWAASLVLFLMSVPLLWFQLRSLQGRLDHSARELASSRGETRAVLARLQLERGRTERLLREAAEASTVQFVLTPGWSRSDVRVLALPRGANFARFQLALEPDVSVRAYRVVLQDAGGGTAWSEQGLGAGAPAGVVSVRVPAAVLGPGEFRLVLYALDRAVQTEIATYGFRLTRP